MKRLLLLFGMLSCWISMNGQDFNETSPSVCGVAVGDTLHFSFTQVGQPNGDGTVKMLYYGDLDGGYTANEAFVLFDENNNQIGYSTNASSQCASAYDSISFTIPLATLSTWTADGTINLKVYSMSGVNPLTSLCPLGSCAIIRVKYPQVTGPNNAGVFSVDSPRAFCPGTESIYTTIGNAGTNRITSVTVNWSFDGVVQTPISYTNTLDTVGGTLPNSAQILLGSKSFLANTSYEIKVWTSNPNAVADTSNLNDTATVIATPALSGTYTVDDAVATGGSNFNSFSDAFSTFSGSGLCGPVVLNVLNGPYNEQFTISNVNGSSATNTITINGNGATISDSGNVGSNNAVILLDGADYVTIDSLNIINTKTSNAVGVQFMNQADNNILRNCNIEMSLTSTTSTVIPITWSGSATSSTTSGDNGNYNLVERNTLSGGYYGIRHYGTNTTVRIVGNEFRNNTVADFYYYGIYNYYTEETKIVGNEIHRLNRGTVSSFYAIYNYYSSENVEITDNWMHDGYAQASGSTNTTYGIYMSACDNSTGNEGLVANNLYADNNNGGTHYAIYNSSSDGWSYYHNTIVENDPGATGTGVTYLFYQSSLAADINFKNNLLYLDRGTSGTQYLAYLQTTTSDIDMDNNAFYMPAAGSTHDFGYYGAAVADFTAWKAVNSSAFDQNSAEGDPFFADPANDDYTPGAAYFNDIGDNLLSVVPSDITGAARSTTPDPGAYEFSPPPGPDMSISNIYAGGASCGTTTDIIVEVLSQGTDTVTSFSLTYTIGGVAQTPIPVTGVFATGDIDSISITGVPISGTAITTVVATITTVAPGTDTDPSNNVGTIDLRAGLSGTYTIDQSLPASATNFVSFSSFGTALETYGICGNVIANVAGTANVYNEQLWLNEITGASSSATVTINGNGNTLQYLATTSSDRATVTFFGTDWVTIDSLNIVAMGGSGDYGFGVILTNDADHNTFRNSNITVASDQTSSNFAGFVISGSLTSATTYGSGSDYNTLENNVITGGYYGLTVLGESPDSTNGNVILNNTIQDFYYYGLYAYYHRDIDIVGNDISRPTRTTLTTMYGLRAYYGMNARIEGNRVHDPMGSDPTSTSTMYPFYGYYLDQSIIANNVLDNMNGDGTLYAFYLGYLSNTSVTHNTIVLDDDVHTGTNTPTTRGVYFVGSLTGGSFDNNLIYFDRAGGNPQMFYSTVSISNMDYNAYYIPSSSSATFGYYSGTTVTDLASWQSASGGDEHSVHLDPYFVDRANGDYTPQSSTLDGFGVDHTSIVPNDFTGMVRNVPVDAGAIEFTGAPCTGLSGVTDTVGASSGTVSWRSGASTSVDILWGPVGFMQASLTPDTVHVNSTDTSGVIAGLSSNTCYDYYLKLNCSSSIPGAPPLLGPYTMCTQCAGGALAGTYTVGGAAGPSNFATLDSVIAALNGCGIQAPVVFNLQGGTHNGFTLGAVSGSNSTNTITFNGSASFGDTIQGVSTAAVDLDGASYVNFNDLHISNTGNFVVWMHNGSHHLNFDNCDLLGSLTTSTSSTGVFVASNSATSAITTGDNASHVSLTNSNVKGNYYGVSFYGSGSTAFASDLELVNNTLTDQYYYGIRTYYVDTVVVQGNSLTNFRNTASYGMYLYYTNNATVLSNEVYGASTAGLYLYYSNYYLQDPGNHTIVANNMLQSTGSYGMYMYYPIDVDVYHNSIQGGSTYGMYLSGSATLTQDVNIKNNIIEMTGTGTAMYVGTAPANTVIDYNLYNSGGNIGYDGGAQATLAAWKLSNTSWNQNSVGAAPSFAAADDFHILGVAPNDVGDNTVGILVDIDGDVRPASGSTVVDMGADEYTPVTHDIALINGELSKKSKCLSAMDSVVLDIQNAVGTTKNFGTTSLTATWSVTGPINSNGTITVNSGTLAPQDTMRLIGTPVDLSIPGVYTLNAYISPSAENLTGINDTLGSVSFTIYDDWDVQPDTVVVISNMTDTVVLEAKSPFLSGGTFFISEVSHFRSTNGAPTGGWAAFPYIAADDYIEVTGVPGSDLDGITLEQWDGSSMIGTYTFTAGTILGPNGTAIIAIGQLGSSVPSPSNFYYHGNGTYTGLFSSGGNNGRILKDGSGNIIDAVGVGSTYNFPAASGVTAADWSGNAGSHSGMSGVRLTGPDLNNASNWVLSSVTIQDPNTLNAGVPVPAANSTAGFDWKLNGVVIDTLPQTVVGPYTTGGVYEYVATFNGPCGVFSDTVKVIVNLPGGGCLIPTNLSGSAPACDSVVLNWNSAVDSALVAYAVSGSAMGAGNLVVGDSMYSATGLTANTNYDFYVANICGSDTTGFTGPYTINSGSAGAPVAAFTPSAQTQFGMVYDFDANASTGNGNTYTWDFGDGNTGTGVNASNSYATGGSYTVTLIVSNACGADTVVITLADVSLGENVLSQNLKLYPNPARDVLNVELNLEGNSEVSVRILDMSGKQVLAVSKDKKGKLMTESIDISALAKGVYMIEVSDSYYTAVRRLVKE